MEQVDLKKQFEEHGWVLVKNIFSEAEIEQMREKVYASKKSGHKGDLLSSPYLHTIVYDDRILNIVRKLIGDDIIYFGDSTYLVDNKQWGFHKDNPDRIDPKGPDWTGEKYDAIRVGIYLQDHINSPGGLLLRDKSHNLFPITAGKAFNVPVEKGDVAIWYLKTTHSGNAKLFRFFPGLIINPKYYQFVPEFMFIPAKTERIGVFLTYGKKTAPTQRFIDYLKTRQYGVTNWQNSNYDPKDITEAEKHGLKIIDMRAEVKDVEIEKLNLFHADIPY